MAATLPLYKYQSILAVREIITFNPKNHARHKKSYGENAELLNVKCRYIFFWRLTRLQSMI